MDACPDFDRASWRRVRRPGHLSVSVTDRSSCWTADDDGDDHPDADIHHLAAAAAASTTMSVRASEPANWPASRPVSSCTSCSRLMVLYRSNGLPRNLLKTLGLPCDFRCVTKKRPLIRNAARRSRAMRIDRRKRPSRRHQFLLCFFIIIQAKPKG